MRRPVSRALYQSCHPLHCRTCWYCDGALAPAKRPPCGRHPLPLPSPLQGPRPGSLTRSPRGSLPSALPSTCIVCPKYAPPPHIFELKAHIYGNAIMLAFTMLHPQFGQSEKSKFLSIMCSQNAGRWHPNCKGVPPACLPRCDPIGRALATALALVPAGLYAY
jgi:hypothetical protein